MNTKRKKNILLVDDDPFLQCLYRKTLEREGFNMLTASDGLAAVERLSELAPDLVVLDLLLPKLDGLQVLEAIRANNVHKDLPVLILSNAYLPQMAQKAIKAGATSGVLKSECSPKRLVKIIRQLLKAPVAPKDSKDNNQSAGKNSWISGLLGRKSDNPGNENAGVKAGDVLPDEEDKTDGDPAVAAEAQGELLKTWPTDVSMIRGTCLKYAKSSGTHESVDHLREIYRRLRLLGTRTTMAEWSQISELSSALEAMLFERGFSPDKNISQSLVQTMLQAVDCLEYLFKIGNKKSIQSTAKTKILLVDDDPACSKANELALRRVNFDTTCVADGAAALGLVEKTSFDLILLDINMPGISGLEVCERLRKLPLGKDVPVIIVTIQDDFQTRAQSVLAGANGLVAKPISPLELIVKSLIFLLRAQNGKQGKENLATGRVAASATARNRIATQAGAKTDAQELQVAKAAVEEKVNALTLALASEKKNREEAERQAAEQVERQRKLEDEQAKNQKARDELERMVKESQNGAADASQPAKMDGRARALQSARDFVEDKSKTLTKELAAQTQRAKTAEEQAAECAKRMGELEAALAAINQANETLLRKIEVADSGQPRAELENALAENQKEQATLMQQIEETWQQFETQQLSQAFGQFESGTGAQVSEANPVSAENQVAKVTDVPHAAAGQNEMSGQPAGGIGEQQQTIEADIFVSDQTKAEAGVQPVEQQKPAGPEANNLGDHPKELEAARIAAEEKPKALTEAPVAENKKIESAGQKAARIDEQRSALEAELARSNQAQEQLRAQLAEQQKQLDAQVGNLTGRTKELEASKASVEEQLRALTESLASESKRSEIAEQKAASISKQRSDLEAELAKNAETQAQLHTQLDVQQKLLDAQANTLAGRTKELEASKAAIENRLKELQQTLAAESKRSQSAEEKAASINQQRTALEAELAKSNKAQEQLRAQLAEQEKALAAQAGNLAGRAKELEAGKAAVEQKVKELTEALAAEKKRSEGAEKQAAGINQQHSTLEAELAKSKQAQEQLHAQLAEQQKLLDAQVGKLTGRTKELEASKASVEQKVKELTEALAAESKRNESAERKANAINQQRSALEAELAKSSKAQEQLRAQLAEQQKLLDVQAGDLAGRMKELETGKASVEQKVKELTEALAAEKKRSENAEKQASSFNQQHGTLEAELAKSKQAQEQLRVQLTEKHQLLEAQTQTHSVELGNLKQLQADRSAMEAQIQKLTQALAAVEARVKTLTEELAVEREKVGALTQALAAETKRRETAEQQAAGAGQHQTGLENKLAASDQALAQLRTQLEEKQRLLDGQSQTHNVEVGNLAQRTKELEASRAAMEENVKALTQSLAAESNRRESAELQVASFNQQKAAIEAELAAKTEAQTKLQAQLTEQQQLVTLTAAELEGFRRCANAEASKLEELTKQATVAEKTRTELANQLTAARATLTARETAIRELDHELQKRRDAEERIDKLFLAEIANRRRVESQLENLQAQLDEASGQLAQKCAAERAWLGRESKLQTRIRAQQDELAQSTAKLESQDGELKGSRKKIDELQVHHSALSARVQGLVEESEVATKMIDELKTTAARTENEIANSHRELAGLRYAVLDSSRMSAKLHREHSQKERENMDSVRQLLSSLAHTPLSLAQRRMLAELQSSVDSQKTKRSASAQSMSYPVEMPGFRSSEFNLAEIMDSTCSDIRAAAESAGVAVHVSSPVNISGKVIGYAEHLHQLITLLAVSPLTIMAGINALDLRVGIKARAGRFADLNLRIALSTDASAQELLARLSSVTAAASTLETASFNEAEFGLAAGWQLAQAMGAQATVELDSGKDVCLMLTMPMEMDASSTVEKPVASASRAQKSDQDEDENHHSQNGDGEQAKSSSKRGLQVAHK